MTKKKKSKRTLIESGNWSESDEVVYGALVKLQDCLTILAGNVGGVDTHEDEAFADGRLATSILEQRRPTDLGPVVFEVDRAPEPKKENGEEETSPVPLPAESATAFPV